MREGYIIVDAEPVGLVCLAVHYKNGGMFVAHDVKTHAPLPASNAHGKRAWRSLTISYSPFDARFPNPTGAARAGNSQHLFRDPTKAEMRRFFAKKGSRAYPIARAATDVPAAPIGPSRRF